MKRILLILLVISLSLSCLLIALEYNAFNLKTYINSYVNNDDYNKNDKTVDEVIEITEDLFIYLKGKSGDEILEPNFNEREIAHMRDVQVLFKYGFILKYIAIILSLIIIIYFAIIRERETLGNYIYKGLFINWIILGILLFMVYSDFDKYFTHFHEIFFTNDLWLLDPETDLLIQMLPEELFISMAKGIGLSFLGFVATIQGIGYATTRKGRDGNEKKIKCFKGDPKR